MTTTKKKPHWTSKLVKLSACCEAVEWAREYPTLDAAAYADYAAAYAYARSSAVRKEILAQCAEIVRRHYPKAPRLP